MKDILPADGVASGQLVRGRSQTPAHIPRTRRLIDLKPRPSDHFDDRPSTEQTAT